MVQIGSLQFPDAWIKDKYSGQSKRLTPWLVDGVAAFEIPDITYPVIEANAKGIVYALDGTKYIPVCSDNIAYSISVSKTGAKVEDIIEITISASGVLFYGEDNYGGKFFTDEDKVFRVKITDRFDKYVLKYAFGRDGNILDSGELVVNVAPNERLIPHEKEVYINSCTTAEVVSLLSLLGTYQSLSDSEKTFNNAFIQSIKTQFLVDDMSDVAVKTKQGIDLYTVTLTVVV